MQIEHYFFKDHDAVEGVAGVNITKYNNRTYINLFDIDENKGGPKISDNIFGICKGISKSNFDSEKYLNDAFWSITTGYFNSDIIISRLYDQPLKLRLTDSKGFEHEGYDAWSIEKYSKFYQTVNGQILRRDPAGNGRSRTMDATPKDVFVVESEHGKDGVIYCSPDMYGTNLHDRNKYILADTKKLIAHLKDHNPNILEHAKFKYGADTIVNYTESNSFKNPINTGGFVIAQDYKNQSRTGITMSNGYAGVIELIQEMQLPFVPLAVSPNGYDDKIVNELIAEISYGDYPPSMRQRWLMEHKL